jgi:hypothetical protein
VDLTGHLGGCGTCQSRLEQLSGANPAFLEIAGTLKHAEYLEEAPIRRLLAHLGSDRSATASFGGGQGREAARLLNIGEGAFTGILAPGLLQVFAGAAWQWAPDGHTWQVLLAAPLIALGAVLALFWVSAARTTRRRNAALEAYADREIARDLRLKAAPPNLPSRGRNSRT